MKLLLQVVAAYLRGSIDSDAQRQEIHYSDLLYQTDLWSKGPENPHISGHASPILVLVALHIVLRLVNSLAWSERHARDLRCLMAFRLWETSFLLSGKYTIARSRKLGVRPFASNDRCPSGAPEVSIRAGVSRAKLASMKAKENVVVCGLSVRDNDCIENSLQPFKSRPVSTKWRHRNTLAATENFDIKYDDRMDGTVQNIEENIEEQGTRLLRQG